ncbi:unnamed protein product, partial [Adineta steineri]
TVCYTSNNDNNQSIIRPRASTIVNSFKNLPSATLTPVVNPTIILSTDSTSISKEEEEECLPIETLSPKTSNLSSTSIDINNANKDNIDSTVFVQNHLEKEPSPAYIVET